MRHVFLVLLSAACLLSGCQKSNQLDRSSVSEPTVSAGAPVSRTEPSSSALSEPELPGEPDFTLLDTLSLSGGEAAERITFQNELGVWEDVGSLRLEYPELLEAISETFAKIGLSTAEPVTNAGTLQEYTEGKKRLLFQFEISGRDRVTDLIILEDGTACFLQEDTVFSAKPADPAQMNLLRTALIKVTDLYETTPTYCVKTVISPSYLSTRSEAIVLLVINDGRQEISIARDFTFERFTGGAWAGLEEQEPSAEAGAPLTAAPKSELRCELPLTRFADGREPGEYRVKMLLHAAREQLEMTAEYELDEAAEDVMFAAPPQMDTERNQVYDRYLKPLGNYSVLMAQPLESGQTLGEFNVMTLFSVCAQLDGKLEEYAGTYAGDYPADILENTIRKYFPVTEEQIRQSIGVRGSGSDEHGYYDPDANLYHAGHTGYIIPLVQGVVTSFQQNGDTLTADTDWYNTANNEFAFSNTITIQTSDTGFRYTAIRVRE